jgi:hypothetical protein
MLDNAFKVFGTALGELSSVQKDLDKKVSINIIIAYNII